MNNKELIESLLAKDLEQLYIDLGSQILSPDQMALPIHPSELKNAAIGWLGKNKSLLKDRICNNSTVIELKTMKLLREKYYLQLRY